MNPLTPYLGLLKTAAMGLIVFALMGLGAWAGYAWQADNVADAVTARDAAREEATAARFANETNQVTIADLRTANQKLADERRAQLDAATKAANDLQAVRDELGAQVAKNADLRRKMGEKDETIAAYLDGGMPCELARQLWGKQAGYCSD